jgi:serine/threonine protein kinase
MQPPIPLGTLLQQRYRVTKILGQGGFGRTYLAQDTACFDELCVLKEFSPNDRGRDALKKSKELFQREAQVLYQINHPQIPKFRANFEEQKRLFLVQEYAEGKTVAKTLGDRLKNGKTFTETEAVDFLQNMLPVLTHIHNMGIIHRDISPDNIIFRDRDKLPVLIDFGVVKAGVTQLEASTQIHQGTTVGKAGYAPGEQLQTGEAYANSDLYALAVTVVVMMTGRKPESLIDKSTMTWKWHQWVPTLTPWFAKILNKMLSRAPNGRYQSGVEVAQALRSVSDFVGTAATNDVAPGTFVPSPKKARPLTSTDHSSSESVNDHEAQASVPLSRVKRSNPIKSPADSPKIQRDRHPLRGILGSSWGIALGSAAAFILILIPIFLLLKSLIISTPNPVKPQSGATTTTTNPANPVPATTPSPTSSAATPTTVASPETVSPETLTVEVGKSIVKEGALNPNQPIIFSLKLASGQQLKAALTSTPAGGSTMNILAPNLANVDVFAKNTLNWQGNIPMSGEYRIEIVPQPGVTSSFKLEVSATEAAPAAQTTTPATTSPVAPLPTVSTAPAP